MARIKSNLIKNAQCENEECKARLHRSDMYPVVSTQHVEIYANCPQCGTVQVVDRVHRDQVNC